MSRVILLVCIGGIIYLCVLRDVVIFKALRYI